MSRCLPYTPSVKAANREALLEPIKLPRELEKKAKIHKKKVNREKKEKKVKSQNRKGHKENELSTCATIWGADAIARYPQEVESNQLEKSDITEEHELPTLSENMSYLFDDTQSGAKRKRTIIRFKSLSKRSDPVSSDASCSEPTSRKADFKTDLKMTEIVHAPSAKTNVEFEKAASTLEQKVLTCDHAGYDCKRSDPVSSDASCSEPTSGKADFETDLKMTEIVHAPSAKTNVEFEKAASTLEQKVSTCDHAEYERSDPVSSDASCSEPTSGKADFETDLKMTEIVRAPSAKTNVEFEKAASMEQKVSTCDHAEYVLQQSLILNWVQPLFQSVLDDYGDQDWLFETKRENSHGSKRFKASNEVLSGCTSQTFWPQAHWLPESGLLALPFTVPF